MSRDKRSVGAAETIRAPCSRQSTKLRDILTSDKPNLSYADFHREITKNPDDALPKFVGSQHSQVLERSPKEDELVRHMSNLPSYLENGKNYQDKALNVGVLDWKRLEKWRYSQKQVPHKYNGYSPSSTNTTLFSTDDSSTHSSGGQSCSSSSQRVRRLSLQSPVESSGREVHSGDAKSSSRSGHSCSPVRQRIHAPSVPQGHLQMLYAGERMPQEIEVFGGSTQKFEDSTVTSDNILNRQQKVFGTVPLSGRKEPHLKSVSAVSINLRSDKYEVGALWKGKTKIQSIERTKDTRRLQETTLSSADQYCSESKKPGVLLRAKDSLDRSCSGFTKPARTELSVEPAKKFLLARNCKDQLSPSDDICEPTQSYSQLKGDKNLSQTSYIPIRPPKALYTPSIIFGQRVNAPSSASFVPSLPARMFSSPSKSRNAHEKKPVAGISMEAAAKSPDVSGVRKGGELILKARNPSPIRRLSSAMGKMIKNAGSRDISPLRWSGSKDCAGKSRSETVGTSSSENPCSDKPVANNNRGRSSPLRRLLDPLLKPRISNYSEPSKKHPSSVTRNIKSCNELSDCRPGHSCDVVLRSAGATSANAPHNSNNGSATLQALLQVSLKNGLPLFTFAIDNESNILAATVRKSSVPGKAHHSWTYTFFTILEFKRKSGNWLHHGRKGDNHGYIPNVVAQMKVSDYYSPSSIKDDNADKYITREFDLFAVDVGHGDEYATDFHPTNELAAIVVKLPNIASRNYNEDNQSSYSWLDLSLPTTRESSPVGRSYPDSSSDISEHQHPVSGQILSSTVILPGGVHTVPSKGELSRLAHRWRAGSLCDCGGWDLGCQLRVYTTLKDTETRCASEIFLNGDKFQIFSQVGQNNQPVLSLAPFKERIYSVEFNSSLSILQAFAVSVSSIDCRRSPELSEPCNIVEKGSDGVSVYEIQPKISNQAEVPGRYVSYPPHSPVGRV